MKKSLLSRAISAPHIVWAILFTVAPMLFVVYYAFTDNVTGKFTFGNIKYLFNSSYLSVFGLSISYALIATVICLLIAYPLAYSISRSNANSQRVMIMLVMLPMWVNFLIRTYAIMAIIDKNALLDTLLARMGFGPSNIIGTGGAVIFGMVYDYLPYMVLPIYSVLVKLDKRLIEASHDLGCNSVQTFMKVILPLSVSGIISGVTMVFVPSISTFYIFQKLGGGTILLIGDSIEAKFMGTGGALNYNIGSAMSLVLMILILICMAVMNKFSDEDGGVIV
jgi:spermidine/putrescine transport system permease protein